MTDISPEGSAEIPTDEVGPGLPPQLFGGGGGPPRQTQTITINLPSPMDSARNSALQIVVDIVQDGFEGNVEATVEDHGVPLTPREYEAVAGILSSLV